MRLATLLASSIVAAALLPAVPALAQDPDAEKTAAIRELLDVINVRAMMGAIAANAGQGMIPMADKLVEADTKLSAEQKARARADLRARAPKLQADLQRAFAEPKFAEALEKVMIRVYGKVFTTAEVRDITAFYRTPTGQKMQRSTPQLTQESILASAEIVLPVMQEIAARHAREIAEAK